MKHSLIEYASKAFRLLDKTLLKQVRRIECEKEYYGTDYGGWYVCPKLIGVNSIIYSFGVGEDLSFDFALSERFGAHIFAFDPTPRSIAWVKGQKLPAKFKFYSFGVSGIDGFMEFYPPKNPDHISYSVVHRSTVSQKPIKVEMHRLPTITRMLGHNVIDVLKLDVEGAEYRVLEDLLDSNLEVNQILVEFHHRNQKLGVLHTLKAIRQLNKRGYKVFHISPNAEEFSFILS